MGNICIIPARGGSKRIPRKNIKDFLGKPIIAYSIEAALKSNLFDEVMVSTDDDEIAEIAKSFGANVPFMRSEKNSGDYSTTFDVLEEVILEYSKGNRRFDNGCCVYSCSPFVGPEKLNLAFNKLLEEDYDSVFPVVEFSFPIQRALRVSEGKVSMFNKEHLNTRSQDLEKAFHDAGQFYWCNEKKLHENKKIISENTGGVIISEMEAEDIDTPIDWKLAEIKYSLNKQH